MQKTKAMKAAIALLSGYAVQNAARQMVYEIYRQGEVEFLLRYRLTASSQNPPN